MEDEADRTSLKEIIAALKSGEASAEEQEAAASFIEAVSDLAESAMGFAKLLHENDWVGVEEEDEQVPSNQMN